MKPLDPWRREIADFVGGRGWDRTQNPKDLAITLALEAAEVLEHFQWLSRAQCESLPPAKQAEVGAELADVMLGAIRLADLLGIDLEQAFADKMAVNRRKYPPTVQASDAADAGGPVPPA